MNDELLLQEQVLDYYSSAATGSESPGHGREEEQKQVKGFFHAWRGGYWFRKRQPATTCYL